MRKNVSIRDEYDGRGTLTLWGGSFASEYAGVARPKRDGSGYRVTPEHGTPFDVRCPLRTDATWQEADRLVTQRWRELADRRERTSETVTTWADSRGRWHARVDFPYPGYGDALAGEWDRIRAKARRAIRRELEARGEIGAGYAVRVELVRSTQHPSALTTTSVTFAEVD